MVWTTLLVLTSAAGLMQQTSPAWQFTSPDTIGAVRMTPLGTLAVQTGGGAFVLDIANGQTIWSRPRSLLDVIEFSPYGFARTDSGFELVDMQNGAPRWSRLNSSVHVRSFVPMPEHQLLLVYGVADTNPLVVHAVDLESGAVRWSQGDWFITPRKLAARRSSIELDDHAVVWDTDSTMVLYPSHGGPIRVNARTGELVWRVDSLVSLSPPDPFNRSGELLAGDGRIFVPYGKRILAVEGASGRVIWDHHDKYDGLIAQMELTRHGLLIRGRPDRDDPVTAPFLDLLDPATGVSRWNGALGDLRYATAFTLIGDTAFLGANDRLFGVSLATGDFREVAKLNFEGREAAAVLEVVEGTFVAIGSQNIARLDASGMQQYHVYYPAVGPSFLAKFASTALILGANVASIATARQSGGMILITNNPVLSARYHASRLADSLHFIFTSDKNEPARDGFTIVRISKRYGRETGRVWVTDRKPRYVLDPVTGTVVLRVGKRALQALRF
jgi:putative pyrroloquinoline-quinone binding quinoprotein